MFKTLKPPLGVRLNTSHPLARGLVGCLLMNEGGGNKAFDLSGNGKHGTLTATASWDGGYILCENNGESVSLNTPGLVDEGTIIFSFIGSGTPEDYGKLICNSVEAEFTVHRNNAGNLLRFNINGAAGAIGFPGGLDIWDGEPGIFALTWNDTTNVRKVVLKRPEGTYIATATNAWTWDAAGLGSTFLIGDRIDNARSAGGRFGFVYFYNRQFIDAESSEMLCDPFAMFESEPIWLFAQSAAAGGAVAPTGTIYGPLFGPMGGPI